MAEVFTWVPDDGPSGSKSGNISDLRFGDGYRQIAGNGLNVLEQVWPISFNRDYTEVGLIEAFLIEHLIGNGAPKSFEWTPPGPNAVPGFYICTTWRISPRSGQNATLSATFEQVFFP